jgi:hypothetical protein
MKLDAPFARCLLATVSLRDSNPSLQGGSKISQTAFAP